MIILYDLIRNSCGVEQRRQKSDVDMLPTYTGQDARGMYSPLQLNSNRAG